MNSILMKVRMIYNHPHGHPSVPWVVNGLDANAGDDVKVLFEDGARLVASGYAEALPDKVPNQIGKVTKAK